MNLKPPALLYTCDAELADRLARCLEPVCEVQALDRKPDLLTRARQLDPVLVLLDLCARDWREAVAGLAGEAPGSAVIALGEERADPALEANGMDLYAIEDPGCERRRLVALALRAQDHLRLVRENRALRRAPGTGRGHSGGEADGEAAAAPRLPHPFSRALRHLDNVETVLENIVEGVSSACRVSRAGVFAAERGGDGYRLRAGVRCLAGTGDVLVPPDDPLVRWMQLNAHLVSRDHLEHVADASDRLVLEQSLDALAAEAIVPLHGRRDLIGWLFLGRHATGAPFSRADLEALMSIAEDVSLTLENALLYEEVALQKTLAETVLQAVPVAIVAVDAAGATRWFNRTAEVLLGLPAEEARRRPLASVDSRLAGLLEDTLAGEPPPGAATWTERRSGRPLSVEVRPVHDGDQCLGAVAIARDMTAEQARHEQQAQIERAEFWAQIAAAMSHEIRNPLVAINTCAQLLPERYGDPEFRGEFRELVGREVARLDGMIEQLDAFANPRPLRFEPLDLIGVLEQAAREAEQRYGEPASRVEIKVEGQLPPVPGDQEALADCFAHLLTNALEASAGSRRPAVTVTAGLGRNGNGETCLVRIHDNGPGMAPQVREQAFSPLCTTKARGVGLGLPLARRRIEDHHGDLSLESDKDGTTATVLLPLEAGPLQAHPEAA